MEPPQSSSPDVLRPLFAWHPRLLALFDAVPFTQPTGAACWTHGDFHPDQVATDRESGMPRLLDLDRLGPGFAVDDLASWVADHMVEVPSIGVAAAAAPLLRGYASAGGMRPSAREMAAAVGRALAMRAAASLRRLERDAVTKAERLLQQSCELCRVGAAVP
jgi:Ser/Thr protein kinase RdoA (MazF antagonist)